MASKSSSESIRPTVASENNRSMGSTFQELFNGLQNVAKSEVGLIRAEIFENTKWVGKHVAFAIAFGVVALIGVLPFVAFLVIGLGRLIHDNYWLSSLIVSFVLMSVGVTVGYIFIRRLKASDLSFPHTRNSLQTEKQMMKEKVHEISDAIKRRTS